MVRPRKYQTPEEREAYQQSRKQDRHVKGHRKRSSGSRMASKFDIGSFLCWDGEAIEPNYNNKQVYALLVNSDGDYWSNPDGLSTEDCLNALTDDAYHNYRIDVCYGASYDINQFLKDIPESDLRILHKSEEIDIELESGKVVTDKGIWYKNFKIREYIPHKCFTVSKYAVNIHDRWRKNKAGKWVMEPIKTVTLWDVTGFFQGKFVEVFEKWVKGENEYPAYQDKIEKIQDGKIRRGSFTLEELETFVLPYTLLEVECLLHLMNLLHRYLVECDIKVKRWDGAGACASAVLEREKVKEHIDGNLLPEPVTLAAEYAYFGGRFESFMVGPVGDAYHYDINSAFPSEQVKLPSLVGTWNIIDTTGDFTPFRDVLQTLKEVVDRGGIFLAHIDYGIPASEHIRPFLHRTSRGMVVTTTQGQGWYYHPEVLVAMEKLHPNGWIDFDKIYYFVPNNDVKPFAFMQRAYDLRKEWKKQGKGAEKVLKLGALNSVYGKLAQSAGYDKRKGKKPPFHNILLAGLITSGIRARMYLAGMQAPMSIISFAADGIYSKVPLDLPCGDSLGTWEYTYHPEMVIVQAGFYWYIKDGKWLSYYRGFDQDSITREQVLEAWSRGDPSVQGTVTRFRTLGSCVALNDFSMWRTWSYERDPVTGNILLSSDGERIRATRDLDITGLSTKRTTSPSDTTYPKRTYPLRFGTKRGTPGYHSSKYSFIWDNPIIFEGLTERQLLDDLNTE